MSTVLLLATTTLARAGDDARPPTPDATRAALERAVAFLRRAQLEDGSWDVGRAEREALAAARAAGRMVVETRREEAGETSDQALARLERLAPAATARAIEALHVAGGDPLDEGSSGGRAIAWLRSIQEEDGSIGLDRGPPPEAGRSAPRVMNHLLATHALALAARAAPTPERLDALTRAVQFLTKVQVPGDGFTLTGLEADALATTAAARAVTAAEAAGVAAPSGVIDGLAAWFEERGAQGAYDVFRPGSHDGLVDAAAMGLSRPDERKVLQTSGRLCLALSLEALVTDGRFVPTRGAAGRTYRDLRATWCKDEEPPALWWGIVSEHPSSPCDVEMWRATLACLRGLPSRKKASKAWGAAVSDALVRSQDRHDLVGSWAPEDAYASTFGRVFVTATAALALHETLRR